MKAIGLVVAAAVLTLATGCGGNSSKPDQARAVSHEAQTLTLTQVTRQACNHPAHRYKAGDREIFTADGAGCGQTDVWLFGGPGARDSYVSVAKTNSPVLVGTNWVVVGKVPVLRQAQKHLGGHITGGF